jgi:hypothetical protein
MNPHKHRWLGWSWDPVKKRWFNLCLEKRCRAVQRRRTEPKRRETE